MRIAAAIRTASLSCLIFVGACDSAQSDEVAPPIASPSAMPTPTPSPTPVTVSQAIQSVLPKLDQSGSLGGPDTNSNGIRDDVDTFLSAQTLAASERTFLVSHAKALQGVMLMNVNNSGDVSRQFKILAQSLFCSRPATATIAGLEDRLLYLTFNTPERLAQYERFNKAASGLSITTGDIAC